MQLSSGKSVAIFGRPGREDIDSMIKYFAWASSDFLTTSKHRHARVERAKARKRHNK